LIWEKRAMSDTDDKTQVAGRILANRLQTMNQKQIDTVVDSALKGVFKYDAAVSRKDLTRALALKLADTVGKDMPENLDPKAKAKGIVTLATQTVDALSQKGGPLVPSQDGQTFTSAELLKAEASFRTLAPELAKRSGNGLEPAKVDDAKKNLDDYFRSKGWEVDPLKSQALGNIVSDGDLKVINGPPGSGKTSIIEGMVGALAQDAAKSGQDLPLMVASAPTPRAAKTFAEDAQGAIDKASNDFGKSLAPVEALNMDKLIKALHTDSKYKGAIVMLDEAGMAGMKDSAALLEGVKKSGAKLIMMGDSRQIAPEQAGNPFAILTEEKAMRDQVQPADLKQILRQKDPAQRVASEQFRELKPEPALDYYQRHFVETPAGARPALAFVENAEAALKKTADEYTKWYTDERREGSAVALAPDEKDAKALNGEIRKEMVRSGAIWNNQTLQTKSGARDFAEAERVMIDRPVQGRVLNKDGLFGKPETLDKGSFGKVKNLGEAGLVIELDDKRHVQVDAKNADSVKTAFAVSLRDSQGMSVDKVFNATTRPLTSGENLVAFTRHKKDIITSVSKDAYANVKQMAKGLSTLSAGTNASDVADVSKAKEPQRKSSSLLMAAAQQALVQKGRGQ
jgi:ATP-dependent exoDNAse (exonuclease V) alpha subunit